MIPSNLAPGQPQAVGLGAQGVLDKSAVSRFNNTRIAASNSGKSIAAQQPQVPNANRGSVRQMVSQGPSQVTAPTATPFMGGGTATPQVNAEAKPVGNLQPEDLALEYFLSSPDVQEALSKEKLKQYFKGNDPVGAEATVARDVLQSVVSRVT